MESRTRLTGAHEPRWGSRLGLAVLAAVVATVLGAPAPADAHTDLVNSSPGQGSEVPLQLDLITLEFGEELLVMGSDVAVRGPDGEEITVSSVDSTGSVVEAAVVLTTPGQHTLTYRVVGEDGHAVTGELWFTVVDVARRAGVVAPHLEPPELTDIVGAPAAPTASSPRGSSTGWLLPTLVPVLLLLVLLSTANALRVRVRDRARDRIA